MAYRHYIDMEHQCVFIQHFGEVGAEEFAKQVADVTALPNFEKGMNLLRDLSHATLPQNYDLQLIKRELETRIKPQDEALGRNRRAAWVLGNARDFKIIHQFCAITRLNVTIVDRQPFREVGKALKWLGLPEDYEFNYPE